MYMFNNQDITTRFIKLRYYSNTNSKCIHEHIYTTYIHINSTYVNIYTWTPHVNIYAQQDTPVIHV